MSLNMRPTILAGLGLGLCACAADPQAAPCSGSVTTALGEIFQLGYQQSATIKTDGLTFSFSKLVSDSRCPKGVQCIWEGNAELEILVSQPTEPPRTLSLNTSSRIAGQASFPAHRVELVNLTPYPELGHQAPSTDYCASLRVSKAP